jgi:hypothetical protein
MHTTQNAVMTGAISDTTTGKCPVTFEMRYAGTARMLTPIP